MIIPEDNNSKSRIYIILIVLLLISFVVSLYFLQQKSKEIEVLKSELVEQENTSNEEQEFLLWQYDNIVDMYDSLGIEYQSLMGKNEMLDSILIERGNENYLLRTEIDQLKAKGDLNEEEIAKLKALIDQYEVQNKEYLAQIEQLVSENEELVVALEESKAENELLQASNEYLGNKYVQGSLLETKALEITGVKFKNNGKESTTNKINKLEQLRICFETGDNNVIEPGPVNMLIRIVKPSGVTIAVDAMGSGVFENADSEEEMLYTKSIDFDYENVNKRICVYWSENLYEAGEYTIEVYQAGYRIGSGVVTLK